MAWQQSDLDALEKAMASGALTVKFSDKEVTYRSLAEMQQIRDLIRGSLGQTKPNGQRYFANFSKGIV